ncbi:BPL-N domain-containing protein [Desulfovibrionales bacterium]
MHTPTSCAVLWDESHLWGILVCRALDALQVPYILLRAEEIAAGALSRLQAPTLLVPGGWARLKSQVLGESGRLAIRTYIEHGGNYLGFCGGAGLGLASDGSGKFLDLCSWSRKPAKVRLPNFSGHLHCTLHGTGAAQSAALPVWWPSQFAPDPAQPLEVLARYSHPGTDFWSADILWSDVAQHEVSAWEALYGINLNPDLLRGEPCIVRGHLGQGSFVLSYPHLETPDSAQANTLLAHFLGQNQSAQVPVWDLRQHNPVWINDQLAAIHALLLETINFGEQHFLLSWRTPWLLGWRRGVPGSALTFLLAMSWQAQHLPSTDTAQNYWAEHGPACRALCQNFCAQTKEYLLVERRILATTPSSPEASACPALHQRKKALFGAFPGYGGTYGSLVRILDELLWLLLSRQEKTSAYQISQ